MSPAPTSGDIRVGFVKTLLARRLFSTALATAVSAIVLWWLLADGTGEALLEAAGSAHLWPLAAGGLLAIVIQMIRAWRFAVLETGSLALPSSTMIGIATKLVLFNFLLPFKLGELSFPLMMKRAYGTAFGQAAGILILCRLLDLAVVMAIILITAAWLLDPAIHGWNPGLVIMLGLTLLIIPFLMVDGLPRIQRFAGRWPKIGHLTAQMSHGAAMMHPTGQRILVSSLTLSVWITHAVIAWLTAIAIGADFGFVPMAMASASSNIAFALPISGVAGLGPPQAAWATMLHWADHAWAPAIASALLCHGVLLITLSAFGAAFWIKDAFFAKTIADDHGGVRDPAASTGGR